MGVGVAKEVKTILEQPDNEKALRKAFKMCDIDENGSLDQEEFAQFAKIVFDLDCKELKKEIVLEIKQELGSVASSIAGKGVEVALEKYTTKESIERFVAQLFKEGDKDRNGTLDFDEFKQLMKEHCEKNPAERIEGFALDDVADQ